MPRLVSVACLHLDCLISDVIAMRTAIGSGFLAVVFFLSGLGPDHGHAQEPSVTEAEASVSSAVLAKLKVLPVMQQERLPHAPDYLIDPSPYNARVARDAKGRELVLENGLIRRAWRVSPNGACVAYDNMSTGQAMLRSVFDRKHA